MERGALGLLLLLLPRPAAAAAHTLEVRISHGKTTYAQTVRLSGESQANFSGPVTPKGGGAAGQLLVNAVLAPGSGKPRGFDLQFQVDLTLGRGGASPMTFQEQGEVAVTPGDAFTAAECGDWKVELALDAPAARPAPWGGGAPGNYRLTAELGGAAGKVRCSQVVKPGDQSNLVDGGTRNGKKYGFILNSLLSPSGAGTVAIQYQLERTPLGGRAFQIQSEENLRLGRKTRSPGTGATLDWLAEGPGGRQPERRP